jgi:hypothetical protein
MAFWLTAANEFRKNPVLVLLVLASVGYAYNTYAQKIDLESVESNFKTEMVALRKDFGAKFTQIERRISVGQAEAEQTNIEGQLRVLDVEVFNLELIAATSNQPSQIRGQIVKYSSEKAKLLRELTSVENRIRYNTQP